MHLLSDHRNALPAGYRLGDYQIKQLLGDGGFGITYLALDVQLNTLVALKEYLPNELAVRKNDSYSVQPKSPKDTENFIWGLERFVKEAQTLAKFKHPNIVRVLHFFYANNTAYIVMEYEQGQNLANFLKDGETATEAEIMLFLSALLDGLAAVHHGGFLHRDIKPSNIYLRTKDYSPLLIDFGAARYDLSKHSRSITTIVTPGYAPFEQYQSDASQQGVWTDIYSLGAVLYRLISGQIPTEATERVAAVMREKPDPLIPAVKMGRGRYSRRFLKGIDWALAVDEQARPQSVALWRPRLIKSSSLPGPIIHRGVGVKLAMLTLLLGVIVAVGWLFYDLRWLQQFGQEFSTLPISWTTTTNDEDKPINSSPFPSPEISFPPVSPATIPAPEPPVNSARSSVAVSFEAMATTPSANSTASPAKAIELAKPTATKVVVAPRVLPGPSSFTPNPAQEKKLQDLAQSVRETQLRTAAKQRAVAALAKLPQGQLRIMTGAGVRLRQAPRYQADKGSILQIGTIVSELEQTRHAGEIWYRVNTGNDNQGWVSEKYTKPFNLLNAGQSYVAVAQQKLNDRSSNFGDLVDLYNFLQRASEEVELEPAVELKLLILLTLQRSLEQIPASLSQASLYHQGWLNSHQAEIKKVNQNWQVKSQRFEELYEEYRFLPVAVKIKEAIKKLR